MKLLVWLLLLLNVVIFGYFMLNQPRPITIGGAHQAMQADKLRILTEDELAAMPKKPAPVAAVPASDQTACYEWGSFAAGSIARAKNILDKFSLESVLRKTASQDATRYWVYIPPLADAQKAQAKVDELHGLGISDALIIAEPQWRNAISFGVFKDEKLATKLLEDLRTRGVHSAVKGVRNRDAGQASFQIRNVPQAVAGEIDKLKADFPGSELSKVPCQ
jgi:hypothetical protein